MIVYGKNVYSTLQNDMDSIEKVYVLQGLKDAKLLKSIQKSNLKVEYCNRAKLDKIANTTHHNGVAVKVSEIETYSIEQIVSRAKKPGLLVALDGIQDPHNVGAILRTCNFNKTQQLWFNTNGCEGKYRSSIYGACFHCHKFITNT